MARFAIVGIGNTAVTLISYVVLLALGASYIVAGPIAWTLGVLHGYTWNRIWTFDRAPHRTSLMGKYFAVGFLGLCLNTALLAVLVDPIGAAKLFAELIALAVTVLSTYLANRHWVFGSHLSAVTGRAHSRGDA
jgi:putative flippase GtrA